MAEKGTTRKAIVAAVALWLLVRYLAAQQATTPENLSPYEGQTVSNVELAGRPAISGAALERLQSLVTQKPAQPFVFARVEESIQALKRTHEFADVRLDVRPEENGLRVRFLLEPAYYIGEFTFPGANKSLFPYSRLLQVSKYTPQEPYSALDIQEAATALKEYFHRVGFFRSDVEADVRTDAAHRLADVQFNTVLNQRARFGNIIVTGVDPQEAAELQRSIGSFWAWWRAASIRPGATYSYNRLQNAAQYMQRQLNSKGYLSAQVGLSESNYSDANNRADVVFQAAPGQLLHIEAAGARVRGRTMRRLIPLYNSSGSFNSELVEEGEQNLRNYLQSKGYFDAEVNAKVSEHSRCTTVRYEISRRRRGRVAEVAVTGNQHLSEKKLMPHVTVKRARWFSRGNYSDQLVRASVRNLQNVYRNAGYSSVSIDPQVSRRDGDLALVLKVVEGPQDVTESLEVEGNSVSIFTLAPDGLRVTPGNAYSTYLVSQDRNIILARYLSLGYLSATFQATGTPATKGSHRVKVIYRINEGAQVKIAQLIALGRERTQQRLIDVTADLKPGHPLGQEQKLVATSHLYDLDIFDWAQIDTKRPIGEQDQPEDVLIKVHEARRNVIALSFGFDVINRGGTLPSGTVAVPGLPSVAVPSKFTTSESTYWGPTGSFTYTRRNLRGMGQTFSTSAFAARLDQRAEGTYTVPAFRNSSWTASTTGSFEHTSENPVYTARISKAGTEFGKHLDAKKTKTVYFGYTFSGTSLTHLLIPDLVPPQDRFVRLSGLSASYARDTRDFVLDAHKGMYQSFEVDFNPSWLGSNASFARLLGQMAYYKNVGAGIIWANNVRLGLEHAIGDSFVPLSEAFFTGGANTLRGFPLDGAGPQRTIPACSNPADPATCTLIEVPTGGNQLLLLNSELRVPLPIKKGLGVVAFYDGGNVFAAIGFHNFWDQYSNSVGGGLRYATPIGLVRFDIGHNLNPIPGIKPTQIILTLGQAF
jgi:outer membrane protein insertion porin family